MGSYENIVKIEEMKKKVDEGDLLSAQKILDTMDIRKIKNTTDLNLIAEVYSQNERYEEAEELYHKIYEKTKSRKSLFQLIDILIKLNNAEEADLYLNQYNKLAPEDFYNYVFRYKIDKIKGETFEHLIGILEELKKTEYTEKWAYELAKLYYKAGMEDKCIQECSDIVLWFGEGTYVEKAKILRSYYSGETDKDRIMDEIKRRAEEVNSQSKHKEQESGEAQEVYEPAPDAGDANVLEENIYNGSDFILHEDTDDFEVGLKKDVQNILTDAGTEETVYGSSTYYEEEEFYSEENAAYQEQNSGASEENQENPEQYPDYSLGTETFQDQSSNYPEGTETYRDQSSDYPEGTETYRDQSSDYPEGTGAYRDQSFECSEHNPDYPKMKPDYPEEKTYFEQDSTYSEDAVVFSRNTAASYDDVQMLNTNTREENLSEEDKYLREISKELSFNTDEIFGNFLHVINIKRQLVKSLDMILHDRSKNSMMIITGTAGSGKTALAKDIALFLYNSGRLKSSKAAKIKAEKLNTVDIISKKETLRDCCLVIEDASELKRHTIEDLLELTHSLPGQLAVVFEENKKNMNKLFRECPRLMDLLKNRIHLPQYNQLDLMGFAYACLKQKDYRLNPDAEQILQNKVTRIFKQAESSKYLEQINSLAQSVMDAADLRTGKQLTDLANQGRLKDVEVLTILPEDFENS